MGVILDKVFRKVSVRKSELRPECHEMPVLSNLKAEHFRLRKQQVRSLAMEL